MTVFRIGHLIAAMRWYWRFWPWRLVVLQVMNPQRFTTFAGNRVNFCRCPDHVVYLRPNGFDTRPESSGTFSLEVIPGTGKGIWIDAAELAPS